MKYSASYKNQSGIITPLVLVIASVLIIFAVSLMNWSLTEYKNTVRKVKRNQSLQIAEAGVNYYKWHLAHDSADFKDGNDWCCDNDPLLSFADCSNLCGPYEHEYKDYNDAIIGQFSLLITPPEVGSTITTVESTGHAYGNDAVQKKVTSLIGKRSLAEYSFLANSPLWLGENEGFSGPIHSNGGIRFDTVATAEVTSAVESYNCAGTGHGCTGIKDGIWGSGGPTTFWRFPVPVVDFDLFSVSLADIKAEAIADGLYFGDNSGICGDGICGKTESRALCPADCLASCGNNICNPGENNITCTKDCPLAGYLVRFLLDGTVNVYKVNTLMSQVGYYNFEVSSWRNEAEQTNNITLLNNFPMPANGLIFIEDDVWVDGIVNGKVTVGAAIFPIDVNNYARIRINDNIQYLARNGNNVLGLMAQGDILVPKYAPTDLTIDAMLLSQNGHVYYREYIRDIYCYLGYSSYCDANRVKNSIEVYGGIITNLFWTWTWVDWDGFSWVTVGGYDNTSTIYNNFLTFAPPPFFPTSENFEVLSWEEE